MNYKKMIRALYLIRDELADKVKSKSSKSTHKPKGFDFYVKNSSVFKTDKVVDSAQDDEIDKARKIHLYNPACDEAHEIDLSPVEREYIQSINVNYDNPTEADVNEIKRKIEELSAEYESVVKYVESKLKDGAIVVKHSGNEIDLTNYVQYNQQEAIRRLLEFDETDATEDIVDTYVTLFYALRQYYFPNDSKERNILKGPPVFEDEYTFSEHIDFIKSIEIIVGKAIVYKIGAKGSAYICPRLDRFAEAMELLRQLRRETKLLYEKKLREFNEIKISKNMGVFGNGESKISEVKFKHEVDKLERTMKDLNDKIKYLNYFTETYITHSLQDLEPIINAYSRTRSGNELRERDPETFKANMSEMGKCLSEIEYYSLSTRNLAHENIRKLSPEVLTYMEENNIELDMTSFNKSIREYRHERIKRAYQKLKTKEK